MKLNILSHGQEIASVIYNHCKAPLMVRNDAQGRSGLRLEHFPASTAGQFIGSGMIRIRTSPRKQCMVSCLRSLPLPPCACCPSPAPMCLPSLPSTHGISTGGCDRLHEGRDGGDQTHKQGLQLTRPSLRPSPNPYGPPFGPTLVLHFGPFWSPHHVVACLLRPWHA